MASKKILRIWRNTVLPLLGLMVFAAYQFYFEEAPLPGDHNQGNGTAIAEAYQARRSGIWVEVAGQVVRTLPDDREGARHQRFILRLPDDLTVLVAHNIDIAERVPLRKGDKVALRGRYEWNEKGGVLHWTHHDPGGGRAGGWISYQNKRYR